MKTTLEFGNLSHDEKAQLAWMMGLEAAPLYERLADLEKEVEDYDENLEKAKDEGYQEGYAVATNRDYQLEIDVLRENVTKLKSKVSGVNFDLEQIRGWVISTDAKTVANRRKFANWIEALKKAKYL
jgi:flagellar biosynthesis chaperone FliJ